MLSAEVLKEIDRTVAKYPADQKQSAVMAVLTIAQSEKGRVSLEVIQFVAEHLGIPPVWIEEVVTPYNTHDTKPVGRSRLSVYTSLLYVPSGGECAADYLRRRLDIGLNEVTADDNSALKEGECMDACDDAPVMIVNNTYVCSFMNNEKLDVLIADLQSEAPTNGAGK